MAPRSFGLLATAVAALLALLAASPARASDFDVVLTEIHYHPMSDLPQDEFLEIVNRGPTTVDLGGWRFTEGIDFVFPLGTSIAPLERLVISPDAAAARVHYGLDRVLGNWTGRLDNDGEILTLVNLNGDIVSRVHYLDEGDWPSRCDGLGPSLELVDPHAQPDLPRSWGSSVLVDGTPGAPNSREQLGALPTRVLVSSTDLFRYAKGPQEPSNPVLAWAGRTFDDSSWATGPGAFGYGGPAVETELTDMRNAYTSLYLRAAFTLEASDLAAVQNGESSLTLNVRYDDGFVGYLNGSEIGRANADNAGNPPPATAVADANRSGQAIFTLDDLGGSLIAGTNVIALHGLNNTIGSSDFLLEMDLRLSRRLPSNRELRPPVVINEIRPTEGATQGYIELYNRSASPFALGGYTLIDSTGQSMSIAPGTNLPVGGRIVFTATQLDYQPGLAGRVYALARLDNTSGELELVDGVNPRSPPAGTTGLSFGRFPDGSDDLYLAAPTQGAPNVVSLSKDVVINEIHYHPPFVAPGGGCTDNCSDLRQWIEIHNRGAAPVNVAGWSLSKGISLDLPATPALNLPAGGYLVIASSRTTFLAEHPGFDAARVVGDWSRDLSHETDTINLNDALGNRVDHVKYADGKPRNDEEPADGTDDGTFVGSEWPPLADGTGRTLELIHPALDNRDGYAWAAGPVGGTPGAQNATFDATPEPVIGEVEHSPAIPRATEEVHVTCRVSAAQALGEVRLVWLREGSALGGTVTMKDDGLSGDGAAGDGTFGGIIPAQPDRAIVSFRLQASVGAGAFVTAPREPTAKPYAAFTGPYYLYQVLGAQPPVNPSASYYVVLRPADATELASRPETSNVLLPCTFIFRDTDGNTTVRHLTGIRYRGEQTRTDDRKGYRLAFPSEHQFAEADRINLVAASIDRELLVSDLFRRAGMPYPREWSVNLTFQGTLDPLYAAKEHLDGKFLSRFFGDASDGGNLYRAIDPNGDPRAGDLTYYGPDPAEYVPYYEKRTNDEENDYSDIIALCRAFDPAQTPDAVFPDLIESLIDTNQWARYLAIQSAISNVDGSIQTNSGEDYLLYRVPETSGRQDSGKWLLVPWDIEESFQSSTEALFRTQLPSVRRFLTHPRFAPLYYGNLANLRSGVFSRFETRQRFVLINFLFGFGTIDGIDSYITARIGYIDSNVPIELSAGAVSSAAGTALIRIGDAWKYWKGTQAPAGAGLAWTQRGYQETGWLEGPTGIGYADGDDATVLTDMENGYTTLYARRAFEIVDPAAVRGLDLTIDYDDGFVAYLNGVEVARRNAPGAVDSPVAFDATATNNHEAGTAETISLDGFRDRLVAGSNVLAIVGLNGQIDSSDFSLIPALATNLGASGGIGCGTVLYSTTDAIGLSGRANAFLTQSVTVNGSVVPYDSYRVTWTASVDGLLPGENTVLVRAWDGPGGTGNLLETKAITVRRLARSPAQVSGTLNGVTQWTEAAGPYLMTGNVTIPAGSRLEIGPGTLIIGEAGASILVRGEIQALGTEAKPILFRALSCSDRWGGIALDQTGLAAGSPTHTLKYCDLEFGDNPPNFAGCVSPTSSKLLVDHCSFRFLTANAVDGVSARVEVRDSLFEKINEGVHCNSSTVIVRRSTFRGMIGDKDGIDFDLNGPGERSLIEGNLIEDGSDDGIDLQETTVDIRDNVIRNISDKAMSLEVDGPLGGPTITGNLIYNSGTGIALKSGLHLAEGHHNTLVGNQEGMNLFAKAGANDGGHAAVHSMIVWSNIQDILVDARSDISLTHSNVSSRLYPGEGNLSTDPLFVDVAGGDYALKAGSPCIGTGKDGTDMGAVPFTGAPVLFLRADSDASGSIALTDAVVTLTYLFRGGAAPPCLDAADANDDGNPDISDAVYTLLYLFVGGAPPPAPFPAPGVDPTPDGNVCE